MVWTSSLRVSSSSSLSAVNPDVRRPGTATLDTSLTVQDSSSRFPSTSSQTAVDQAWRTGLCGSSMTKRKEIPPAQQEGWENTKQRVMQAASSVLGTTLDVTHEALVLSTELLELSPIPGLQAIAKTLLHIWDSLEDVDICRLQCLHLTERCAYILLSVRQEIEDAGGLVGEELKFPIQKLSQSFRDVFVLLQKQTRRPFLQRYLNRDNVQREIEECHQSLHEALGMFSIRILKQVQESNVRQGKEAKTILEALGHASPSRQEDRLPKPFPASILSDPQVLKHINVSSSPFAELVATQNSIDAAVDAAMLRNVLKSTVTAGNDLVMVETLGVERNEIAEAIKTLERALERILPCQTEIKAPTNDPFLNPISPRARFLRYYLPRRPNDMAPMRSSSSLDSARDEEEANRIDREFLESGIGALRRMSEARSCFELTELDYHEIRSGGTWRSRMVVIKVLSQTTPRDLLVKEVEIWQKLHHPNVLELYGASSTSGDPPWFFVSPYMKEGSLVEFLRKAEARGKSNATGTGDADEMWGLHGCDLLELMSDIAKGMSYLHSLNIIHGDLKASNVLMTDQYNCVITDFGQSDMKSEAYRLSGTPLPHGTLRWQAPELMSGITHLTTKIDVYAFAICCVEILSMGKVPWPLADDITVRNYVLDQDARPPIPCTPFDFHGLHDIVHQCWDCDPYRRPTFLQIVRDIKVAGKREVMQEKAIPSPRKTTSPIPSASNNSPSSKPHLPDRRATRPPSVGHPIVQPDERDISPTIPQSAPDATVHLQAMPPASQQLEGQQGMPSRPRLPRRPSLSPRARQEGSDTPSPLDEMTSSCEPLPLVQPADNTPPSTESSHFLAAVLIPDIPNAPGIYSKYIIKAIYQSSPDEPSSTLSLLVNTDVAVPRFNSAGATSDPSQSTLKITFKEVNDVTGFAQFWGMIGAGYLHFVTDKKVVISGPIEGGPGDRQTFIGVGTWLLS